MQNLLHKIRKFQFLNQCFSDYLKWLYTDCDPDRINNDVVRFVVSEKDTNSLGDLEAQFKDAANILALSPSEFCKAFRIDIERDKASEQKLGDLLAEPWVAIGLRNYGFGNIRKIQEDGLNKVSDFIGIFSGSRYAIEVKNLRIPSEYFDERMTAARTNEIMWLMNNDEELNWFDKRANGRLKSEIATIRTQLANTKNIQKCDRGILVFNTDNTNLLMFPWDVENIIKSLVSRYKEIDHMAICESRKLQVYPSLQN